MDLKVFSILGESLEEYQVVRHHPPTSLAALTTDDYLTDPHITHQCKDPCSLNLLPNEITKSPVSPSLACGFFPSQEAWIQTTPQGFLHHMIYYPFYPGLCPANLCFTLGLGQQSHSQSIPSWFSSSVCYGICRPPRYPLHCPLFQQTPACLLCRISHITGPVSQPFLVHPQCLIPLDRTPPWSLSLLILFLFPPPVDQTDGFHSVPFLSHMLSTLDSTAAAQLCHSTGLPFLIPSHWTAILLSHYLSLG